MLCSVQGNNNIGSFVLEFRCSYSYGRKATFRTPAKASNVVAISFVDGWSCLSAVCQLLSKLSDAFHSNSQHGVNWHVSTLLTSTYFYHCSNSLYTVTIHI